MSRGGEAIDRPVTRFHLHEIGPSVLPSAPSALGAASGECSGRVGDDALDPSAWPMKLPLLSLAIRARRSHKMRQKTRLTARNKAPPPRST